VLGEPLHTDSGSRAQRLAGERYSLPARKCLTPGLTCRHAVAVDPALDTQ